MSIFDYENGFPGLIKRNPNGNKGTFGRVCIIAGSINMNGAAYLSAMAALRVGTGLVEIYTVEDNLIPLKVLIPEAIIKTYRPSEFLEMTEEFADKFEHYLNHLDCVVLGPGLSTESYAQKLTEFVLKKCRTNLVIDADAINIIAASDELTLALDNDRFNEVNKAKRSLAITPHAKELSRLSHTKVEEVIYCHEEVCSELTKYLNIIVVGKGCKPNKYNTAAKSIVSYREDMYENVTGSNALATAGSGDILSGIIGGLCAQGEQLFEACTKGVYIHGLCGEFAGEKLGNRSVIARDILDALPEVLKSLED